MKRPWNETKDARAFWDPETDAEFIKVQSLKDSLKNCNGMRFEDLLRSCAEGLSQVMDAIDEMDYKRTSIKPKKKTAIQCPKCSSFCVMTERRPNGNSKCTECDHQAPSICFNKVEID